MLRKFHANGKYRKEQSSGSEIDRIGDGYTILDTMFGSQDHADEILIHGVFGGDLRPDDFIGHKRRSVIMSFVRRCFA
jgi:hypothetical protein